MKKINPKVTRLAVILMTLLLAGGTALAFKDASGELAQDSPAEFGNGAE
jgi:hypothetical protein